MDETRVLANLLPCESADTETPTTVQGPSKSRGCTDLSKAAVGFPLP